MTTGPKSASAFKAAAINQLGGAATAAAVWAGAMIAAIFASVALRDLGIAIDEILNDELAAGVIILWPLAAIFIWFASFPKPVKQSACGLLAIGALALVIYSNFPTRARCDVAMEHSWALRQHQRKVLQRWQVCLYGDEGETCENEADLNRLQVRIDQLDTMVSERC